jgi:CubicO group peptidase (beta-lactamase class C family)
MVTSESYPRYFPTDSWRTAAPDPRLIDPRLLSSLDAIVARRFPMVTGLLVIRHGYILYERYLQDLVETRMVELYAITQSVVGAVTGIALTQGAFLSLDEKLGDLLPDYFTPAADPRAKEITLRHLLSMTSGFEWDARQQEMLFYRVNHVEDVLNRPLARPPGAAFSYDGCNAQVLSHVFNNVTGLSVLQAAAGALFEPLGITSYVWPQDDQGFSQSWAGLQLTLRDVAKIGYLHLRHGVWESQQLVGREYVRAATTAHTAGGYPGNTGYGYLWWVSQEREHYAFYALGFGGKTLVAVPDLDLLVVIMTDDSLDNDHINQPRLLLSEHIIPAIPAG